MARLPDTRPAWLKSVRYVPRRLCLLFLAGPCCKAWASDQPQRASNLTNPLTHTTQPSRRIAYETGSYTYSLDVVNDCFLELSFAVQYMGDSSSSEFTDPACTYITYGEAGYADVCSRSWYQMQPGDTFRVANSDNADMYYTAYVTSDPSTTWGAGKSMDVYYTGCTAGSSGCYQWTSLAPDITYASNPYTLRLNCPDYVAPAPPTPDSPYYFPPTPDSPYYFPPTPDSPYPNIDTTYNPADTTGPLFASEVYDDPPSPPSPYSVPYSYYSTEDEPAQGPLPASVCTATSACFDLNPAPGNQTSPLDPFTYQAAILSDRAYVKGVSAQHRAIPKGNRFHCLL